MTLIPAFVGIDLAIAKKKKLPVSICTWQNGRLIPESLRLLPIEPPRGRGNAAVLDESLLRDFADETAVYIADVCTRLGLSPKRIAIDAPSAPRDEKLLKRAAEAALDQANINYFPTPSASEFIEILKKVRKHLNSGGAENRIPHANQLWMLAGFRLFQRLTQIAPCIEVFPQATARVMGVGQIHKTRPGGVEAQLSAVAVHTGWPRQDPSNPSFEDIAFGPAHDRLDAYLSAWVAALESKDRLAFGQLPADVIWTPRLSSGVCQQPGHTEVSQRTQRQPSPQNNEHVRICPGCNDYEFKKSKVGKLLHGK